MNRNMHITNHSGKSVPVKVQVTQYANNWQIAILLYTTRWEYYSDLSVFIEPFEEKNLMAVDTNNLPTAEEFIQRYSLWTLVWYTQSWFCTYPIYEMDLDELSKRDKNWVDELIQSKFWDDKNNNLWSKLGGS